MALAADGNCKAPEPVVVSALAKPVGRVAGTHEAPAESVPTTPPARSASVVPAVSFSMYQRQAPVPVGGGGDGDAVALTLLLALFALRDADSVALRDIDRVALPEAVGVAVAVMVSDSVAARVVERLGLRLCNGERDALPLPVAVKEALSVSVGEPLRLEERERDAEPESDANLLREAVSEELTLRDEVEV